MVISDKLINACSNKIPVIVGPTASGKTAFAIHLAQQINGEIINVDSRQVYKGFCIGTAQPEKDELTKVKHNLVNCLDPNEIVSAGRYCEWVWNRIKKIKEENSNPVLTGGTLLYIRSIFSGIIIETDTSCEIRNEILGRLETEGPKKLLKELNSIDPEYAQIVKPNDIKRLTRALEIYYQTNEPPSKMFAKQKKNDRHLRSQYYLIELKIPRDLLKLRIRKRTQKMIANGWLEEVKSLLQSGIDESCHPMQGLGYSQMKQVLDGKMTIDAAESIIATKTWQFARRQLTWLKKMDCDTAITNEELLNA